jgi:hypothetical protein
MAKLIVISGLTTTTNLFSQLFVIFAIPKIDRNGIDKKYLRHTRNDRRKNK